MINERIKAIRMKLQLSQKEFGKQIGISDAAVSKLEKGINNPSEQTIFLICSEFNVNAEYLKDGADAPMFLEEGGEEDAVLRVLMGADPRKRDTLRTLCEMPQECWDAVFTLCDYIQSKKNNPGQE
jgi:transcriptional regulator with XRE-family HTH domain